MKLCQVVISFFIFVYLVVGKANTRCKDVIVGYNTTRVELDVNASTGQIDVIVGYNLFYPNGSWVTAAPNSSYIGSYYVDDSRENEGICYLHLVTDIQHNTTMACLTYTPTEESANIKGVNGCYNFGSCTQQCSDSNGDLINQGQLFSFFDYTKID